MNKKIMKAIVIIFLVDLLSNIALLLFFGVPITQQAFIGAGVFTILLTLILKQTNILKEE